MHGFAWIGVRCLCPWRTVAFPLACVFRRIPAVSWQTVFPQVRGSVCLFVLLYVRVPHRVELRARSRVGLSLMPCRLKLIPRRIRGPPATPVDSFVRAVTSTWPTDKQFPTRGSGSCGPSAWNRPRFLQRVQMSNPVVHNAWGDFEMPRCSCAPCASRLWFGG